MDLLGFIITLLVSEIVYITAVRSIQLYLEKHFK